MHFDQKMCSTHFRSGEFRNPTDTSIGYKTDELPLDILDTTGCDLPDLLMVKSEPPDETDSSGYSDDSTKTSPNNLPDNETARLRRERNARRTAMKRLAETPEQRADRQLKDLVRSARRREHETELQTQIRRYNDAVRAAYRRSNETEEQRQRRRMIDIVRAAKRRQTETPEQRQARLKSDRERAARRRMQKKGSEHSCDGYAPQAEFPGETDVGVVHHFASVNGFGLLEDAARNISS